MLMLWSHLIWKHCVWCDTKFCSIEVIEAKCSIETLVFALIMDNCNVLYYGIPKKEMNRLQESRIQRQGSRCSLKRPNECKLHWCWETHIVWITFLATKNHRTIHQHTPARSLRSSLQNLLTVQSVKTQTYAIEPSQHLPLFSGIPCRQK